MGVIVFDTGFLLSLAAHRPYADAVCGYWSAEDLWAPEGLWAELRWRQRSPRPDLPPELPGRALGILASGQWRIRKQQLTEDEIAEATNIAARIGLLSDPANMGESEATVLIANRCTGAILATDDKSALTVLDTHMRTKTGQGLPFAHSTTIIREMEASGRITAPQRVAFRRALAKKQRPLL